MGEKFKKLLMCIMLIVTLVFVYQKIEIQAETTDMGMSEVFSKESLEWLENTKQIDFSVGFPSSESPFFYKYSGIEKGVLKELTAVFREVANKGIKLHRLDSADANLTLLDENLNDVVLTGKQDTGRDVYYTEAVVDLEYAIFLPKYSDVKVVDDLTHKSVGIVNNDDMIIKYLNNINSGVQIETFKDYMNLYEAMKNNELSAIFVPKELFTYKNKELELAELPISHFTGSSWYFKGKDESVVKIFDEVLDVFCSEQSCSEIVTTHANTLYNKLYNFESKTHEWLTYEKPTIKVGVYETPGFMSYNSAKDEVTGLLSHVLNQLTLQFGIEFEYVHGTYEMLYEKFQEGELDILPKFSSDIDESTDLNRFNSDNEFVLYQGEMSVFGHSESLWVDKKSLLSNHYKSGMLVGEILRNDHSEFNHHVTIHNSLGELIEDLDNAVFDYLILDPMSLVYFTDYGVELRGRVGKYEFGLVVQDENKDLIEFFNKVNERDFSQNRFLGTYKNVIGTSTYLNEMSLLQNNLVNSQNQVLWFGLVALLVLIFAVYLLSHYVQNRRTEYLKYTDPLTGVYNRAGYHKEATHLVQAEVPFTFIIFDIDKFKRINDTLGHQTGDEVILFVAKMAQQVFPSSSVICRMGGDEFIVCLCRTKPSKVIHYLDILMHELLKFKSSEGEPIEVMISSGVVINEAGSMTLDEAYRCADKALYESKQRGRNRYTFYADPKDES